MTLLEGFQILKTELKHIYTRTNWFPASLNLKKNRQRYFKPAVLELSYTEIHGPLVGISVVSCCLPQQPWFRPPLTAQWSKHWPPVAWVAPLNPGIQPLYHTIWTRSFLTWDKLPINVGGAAQWPFPLLWNGTSSTKVNRAFGPSSHFLFDPPSWS